MSKLGGWWRIWVVLSVLFLTIALIDGLSSERASSTLVTVPTSHPTYCVPFTATNLESDAYQQALANYQDALAGKVARNDKGEPFQIIEPVKVLPVQVGLTKPKPTYEIFCAHWSDLFDRTALAVLLSLAIALIGVSGRWVYRGFKRSA